MCILDCKNGDGDGDGGDVEILNAHHIVLSEHNIL